MADPDPQVGGWSSLWIFLGRGVSLGLWYPYPIPDHVQLHSATLFYLRLDVKNVYPIPDLLVSRNFISVSVSCLYGKLYPIFDQSCLISIPYHRLNCSETLSYKPTGTKIFFSCKTCLNSLSSMCILIKINIILILAVNTWFSLFVFREAQALSHLPLLFIRPHPASCDNM